MDPLLLTYGQRTQVRPAGEASGSQQTAWPLYLALATAAGGVGGYILGRRSK